MNQTQIMKWLFGLFFGIVYALGLCGCMYSTRLKRFYISPLLLLWCVMVTIVVTTVCIKQINTGYTEGHLDLQNAVNLYYYMNIGGVLINYAYQLVQTKQLLEFFNTVPLFDIIEYFVISKEVLMPLISLVIVKIIIFPIIIEISLILQHMRYEPDHSVFKTLFTLYPIVISNFLPNCVFGILVICRERMTSLNGCLRSLQKEANFYQDIKQMVLHKLFYRMQIFCNLSDKLDELSEKYSAICLNTLRYVDLHALPILASLLCNLMGITAGLFQQYYAVADTLINKENYDVFDAVTNGIFLLISVLEIGLYGIIANECIETIRETSLILKRIQLNNCDIRFRQTVERFSLQIFVEQFKIQPMGLLEINMSLLHDVLSAVTSFLLILIQSDLTLRFSLK